MTTNHIIAIDPGAKGAAALFDAKSGSLLDVFPFLGRPSTRDVFLPLQGMKGTVAVIEAVSASPVQGSSSAFAFGQYYEMWLSAAWFYGVPLHGIRPPVWQKPFNLKPADRMRKNKKTLVAMAKQLFPEAEPTLTTADALLIGWYVCNHYQKTGEIPGAPVDI